MTDQTTKKASRPRGTGSIYLQKGSAVYWVKYYRNGKPYRESTHKTSEKEAQDFLKQRLAEIVTGNFYGPKSERIRIDELADDLLRDYRINGKRSLGHAEARWKLHLKPSFGDLRAIARYVDKRQQQKAKNATINRELAALKRMFHLGYRMTPPKVTRIPAFPRLAEDNIRKGFLDDYQYEKLFASARRTGFRHSSRSVGPTDGGNANCWECEPSKLTCSPAQSA